MDPESCALFDSVIAMEARLEKRKQIAGVQPQPLHYSEFVGSHPGQVPQFLPTLPIISFLLHRLSYLLSGFKAVATGLETLSRITPPDPGYLLSCPTLYRMF